MRSITWRRGLLRPVLRVLAEAARGASAFVYAFRPTVLAPLPNFKRFVTPGVLLLLAFGTPPAQATVNTTSC